MKNLSEKEEKILEFWKKNKIFEKSLKQTKKGKNYVFYDGPPFATGLPHYGHILGSVAKDLFGRFHTMKGEYVRRVWGWDCHGLPIENIAEKGLEINSKDEIEKMGVKKFNDYCRSCVLEYADAWNDYVQRIGRWVNMEDAYKTMDNEYIESVWWAFKQLWEKGYIYQGERVLMYCPRCSTPLAKAEIAMDNSYRTIKEDTIVVKFKLEEKMDGKDVYALAWTTTPWTLPSNLALTINPDLEYVYVKDKSSKEIYLLAKKVLEEFYKDKKEYEIIKKVKGRKLEGQKYEPLFPYFKGTKNAFRFLLGDFVNAEDGTGIVHTAPAFGEEDYDVCKKYNIPTIQPVDEKGHFTSEVKDFKGKFVHGSNKDIIKFLKSQNKIVLVKKMEHEYPFCYRCDTKLIYRAIPAWFVDIQKIKPKLLKKYKEINWYPEFLQEGRVKYTIQTAPDWNISRNRYWATAMPIWVSEDGEKLVISSIEELKKYSKKPLKNVDLHKDYLDEVVLEKDGKEFERIPEVLDCWFESGSMSFAQFHYPFGKDSKKIFKKNFPADFVVEYIAQVRTWFYYMSVLSIILFDDIPFENVVTTGTVLSENGEKMSKSKGNFTDPMILIKKYGVDAIRFHLMNSSVMNAEDLNFSDKNVEEIYKKVMLIFYNTKRFYEISKINEKPNGKSKELTDKWILSRLNQTGVKINKYLEDYNTIKATDEIRKFVEDLSTWYLRINRDRVESEKSARETFRHVLLEFSKICAPVIPFAAEEVYQSVKEAGKKGKKSVHLESWPKFNKKKIDKNLLENMSVVRDIVSTGLRERDRAQIGLKWPLKSAKVISKNSLEKKFFYIIKDQLNIKEIDFSKTNKDVEESVKVELDTKLTPELEAEGYAREVSRKIQAFRKKLGLRKEQKVKTWVIVDDEFKKILEKNKEMIADRTNSKKLEIVTTHKETFKNKTGFNIKDKRGEIGIVVT